MRKEAERERSRTHGQRKQGAIAVERDMAATSTPHQAPGAPIGREASGRPDGRQAPERPDGRQAPERPDGREAREPGLDEPLIAYLELDQLTGDRARPLPPARLGRGASIALWALRIFVVVIAALVIYTFIANLGS